MPTTRTVTALTEISERFNPTGIGLDIETSIPMDFFDFKVKWENEFPHNWRR
jgi:hypothetical protein